MPVSPVLERPTGKGKQGVSKRLADAVSKPRLSRHPVKPLRSGLLKGFRKPLRGGAVDGQGVAEDDEVASVLEYLKAATLDFAEEGLSPDKAFNIAHLALDDAAAPG